MKKEFDVYFEVYGKKLKRTVIALTEFQAMEQVKDDIQFHKIVPTPQKTKEEVIAEEEKLRKLFEQYNTKSNNYDINMENIWDKFMNDLGGKPKK